MPGAVRVPCQHALSAAPVQAAVGQRDLQDASGVAHIEDALGRERCRAEPPLAPVMALDGCWVSGGHTCPTFPGASSRFFTGSGLAKSWMLSTMWAPPDSSTALCRRPSAVGHRGHR